MQTINLEWRNKKVLLYSTGNYTQYPMTNHNGKEYLKQKLCICKTEYSKDWHHTVNQLLQLKKKKKKDTGMAESQSPLPIPHNITPSLHDLHSSLTLSWTPGAKRLNLYTAEPTDQRKHIPSPRVFQRFYISQRHTMNMSPWG